MHGFNLVTSCFVFCFPSLGTEELVTENKRLKGIGLGAPEGPISLDDFRSLQRSNTVRYFHILNGFLTLEACCIGYRFGVI